MAIENLDPPPNQSVSPGRGSYPIPLNVTTSVGFLGRTERGPLNEPVVVESFPEYCRCFGGHFVDGAVSHAVHDFFLHGGRRAVIVRVANRATRARLDIPTETEFLSLQARHPGRHEILRVSIDYEQVESDECLFNLVVQRLGSAGTGTIEDQELYPQVSTRPGDARYIADVLKDSRLIALAGPPPVRRPVATPPKRPGAPVRYIDLTAPGDDGEELTDYDIIGSDRDATGLFAFARGPRIDLLAIPMPPERELGTTAFVAAARFCEDKRALLIWDPPASWSSIDSAMLGSRQLEFSSGNVMTYFPRIRPRGARVRLAGGMPACGAIAGMLAQRDRRGLWGRDAESDYTLRTALTPVLDVTTSESRRLAHHGINTLTSAAGGTVRLAGHVTLGGGSNQALESRRLRFFILNAVEDAALDSLNGKDAKVTSLRLEGQLRRFFDDLYLHKALAGQTPTQAYYLHRRPGGDDRPASIRFGFALNEPGRFVEYVVALGGEQPGRVCRDRMLEAEQLFS